MSVGGISRTAGRPNSRSSDGAWLIPYIVCRILNHSGSTDSWQPARFDACPRGLILPKGNVLDTLEREYEYKARWDVIVGTLAIGALMTVGFAYAAIKNDKGGVIFTFEAPPVAMTVLMWVLSGSGAALFVMAARLFVTRRKHRQRIVITPTAIIVPKTPFSPLEEVIPYKGIDRVQTFQVKQWRSIEIYHLGGLHRIAEAALPSRSAFDEILSLVQDRTGQS
jgi:hypothetical protein